jgi:hypothetical protein
MAIPSDVAERLVKLLGMIGSIHDGEALNAARLADRLVREAGLTWTDVIGTVPATQLDVIEVVSEIYRSGVALSYTEGKFLRGVTQFRRLSEKQLSWLSDILERARLFASRPPPPPPPPRPPPKPPKPAKTRKTRGKPPPKPPEPADGEPAVNTPSDSEPSDSEPAVNTPSDSEPSDSEPAVNTPTDSEPAISEAVAVAPLPDP